MRRRSVLALFAGSSLSALAGCNAILPGQSPTSTPAADTASDRTAVSEPSGQSATLRPDSTGATDATSPYRASGQPLLDRPRGVHVRNLGSRERFVTVVVTASGAGEELLAASTPVPAGETTSFPDLLRSRGRYGVLVETADGSRDRYDWAAVDTLDDLWIDLVPDPSFRRPVFCPPDSPFVVGDPTVAFDVPADVGVREALGRAPALAIDTHAREERRVRLKIWHQGRLRLDARYDFPPDIRALVPVFPAGRRYDILLRSQSGESIYDWQPLVRNTLYAELSDVPAFRCGYANHTLQVRNETDTGRRVTVRVLTGETTLFDRSLDVDANATETVPSAVDPLGPFRFEVAVDGGPVEEYNWVRCAPNGPIVVSVSDDGVYVSVRPVADV